MLIVQAPNEELLKDVKDDREELAKQAQDALEANEKDAKEIGKNHGEDTKPLKKIITDKEDKKQLKAMHLSEALFEDYDGDEYYFAVVNACDVFKDGEISLDELIDELTYIKETMDSGEEKSNYEIPGFENTMSDLDNLSIFTNESLKEELSQKGQKVLDELKKELGPNLQKKVAYVIKDYANNNKNPQKKEDKELSEGWSVFHESDIPEEGTLFDDEDSARKFQQEMGEGWEVQLVTK